MRETAFEFLNRHVKVSHETYDRLSLYYDLLLKWQSKINLISNDTISDCWNRHFLDSLQLIPLIPPESINIVDIGSGAGFPGLALAIATNKQIHLIESDSKKCVFLREVARVTGTNATIHHDRIENISVANVDIITARALADLKQLLKLSKKFVSHGTICLFHKGKNYRMEIEDAKQEWSFDCKIIPSVTDPSGALLHISSLQRQGNDK